MKQLLFVVLCFLSSALPALGQSQSEVDQFNPGQLPSNLPLWCGRILILGFPTSVTQPCIEVSKVERYVQETLRMRTLYFKKLQTHGRDYEEYKVKAVSLNSALEVFRMEREKMKKALDDVAKEHHRRKKQLPWWYPDARTWLGKLNDKAAQLEAAIPSDRELLSGLNYHSLALAADRRGKPDTVQIWPPPRLP